MTRIFTIVISITAILCVAAPAADPPRVTMSSQQEIPNIPGKSLVAVVVDYAPGGKSTAHRHAASAFIYAHVISGAVKSQVDDEPVKVYRAGESWIERPGAHHRVSENASDTEPAKLLAVFVVNSGEKTLTIPDR